MSAIELAKINFSQARIGVLGSHSALEVCYGARQEGLPNLVICQQGREKVYSQHYKTRTENGQTSGCVEEVLVLDNFADILQESVQNDLLAKNVIFIPHRSFEVYVCQRDYTVLRSKFRLPIFGNRGLLEAEERFAENNQYSLLQKAGISHPKQFSSPEQIDRLVIVKVAEAERTFERGFFFAQNPQDYQKNAEFLIQSKKITPESLAEATIEEFIIGPTINLNFFYSPLFKRLELLGTDTRRQTSLDGFWRLPADKQMTLLHQGIQPSFEEAGHIAATMLESMLENALEMGQKFVEITQKEFSPGIIGPFALQCGIKAGPPKKELVVYDVSLRMPGSPGTKFTPYGEYLWGRQLSLGQRIAMEINQAISTGQIDKVLT
jgi:5-formaminoimidazole-4-carboxamide-1-(beta)-D-ribofuranosyl 5'-monophosphate synthetase